VQCERVFDLYKAVMQRSVQKVKAAMSANWSIDQEGGRRTYRIKTILTQPTQLTRQASLQRQPSSSIPKRLRNCYSRNESFNMVDLAHGAEFRVRRPEGISSVPLEEIMQYHVGRILKYLRIGAVTIFEPPSSTVPYLAYIALEEHLRLFRQATPKSGQL